MNEIDTPFTKLLEHSGPILCLDIGSGTQDVLLALPNLSIENWPRFVLPSPARLIKNRIEQLTISQKNIWLHGYNMGGGFTGALIQHCKAGLRVFATKEASAAINDNLSKVMALGIEICETPPNNTTPIFLCDYDANLWNSQLRQWNLPLPHVTLAAAQDHGIHTTMGNRMGRMHDWHKLLEKNPSPQHWLYTTVPSHLTRLSTLQRHTGGPVADTGTIAIVGALSQTDVLTRSHREGITIINVGNGHTVAALIYQGKVVALFEHHTGQRDLPDFLQDLKEFRLGWLPDEHVRATGGHGTVFVNMPDEAGSFAPTFILGPKRQLLQGQGQFIAPHGDMMLAGCFGLLRAFAAQFN